MRPNDPSTAHNDDDSNDGDNDNDNAGVTTDDHPDALGLRGTDATYDPPDAPATEVTVRGTEYLRRGQWAVWIETADGVIETTDDHVEVDR